MQDDMIKVNNRWIYLNLSIAQENVFCVRYNEQLVFNWSTQWYFFLYYDKCLKLKLAFVNNYISTTSFWMRDESHI